MPLIQLAFVFCFMLPMHLATAETSYIELHLNRGDCKVISDIFGEQCSNKPSDHSNQTYTSFVAKNMSLIKDMYSPTENSSCDETSNEVYKACQDATCAQEECSWVLVSDNNSFYKKKNAPERKTLDEKAGRGTQVAGASDGKETYVPPVYLLGVPTQKPSR